MVHCTGEPDNAKRNKDYYRHWFFKICNWSHYGYHYVVYQNGLFDELQPHPRPINNTGYITNETRANGCKGSNESTIHVAYVGGIDHMTNKPADTRTQSQKETLFSLISKLKKDYNVTEVIGHQDWPNVRKSCPCFDAKKTYANA